MTLSNGSLRITAFGPGQHGRLKVAGAPDVRSVSCHTVILLEQHAADIQALDHHIFSLLEDPAMYRPNGFEDMIKSLSPGGLSLGVYVGDKRAAYRLTAPALCLGIDCAGHDLGLADEDIRSLAQFNGVAVHRDYRGNALALHLSEQSMNMARDAGFSRMAVTVYPGNYPSLITFFRLGFEILKVKEAYQQYGGMLRYVMLSDLDAPPKRYTETLALDHRDTPEQNVLLEQGWRGTGIEKTAAGHDIVFAR
jgi:GNAT superfamily N-acetyltransferase